jgi:flagellar transcriptional activator FlhC
MELRTKSIIGEAREVDRAVELIRMGARLQVLESEVALSRERLLRLYKEVAGKSPAKGMLPFSTDWFLTWQPATHSALFFNIYRELKSASDFAPVDVFTKAYRLYAEQVKLADLPIVLSVTRAWRLLKFVDAGLLDSTVCGKCSGRFITHKYDLNAKFVCGLCEMPARAGKAKLGESVDEMVVEALPA